jgi:hypothetical protein
MHAYANSSASAGLPVPYGTWLLRAIGEKIERMDGRDVVSFVEAIQTPLCLWIEDKKLLLQDRDWDFDVSLLESLLERLLLTTHVDWAAISTSICEPCRWNWLRKLEQTRLFLVSAI